MTPEILFQWSCAIAWAACMLGVTIWILSETAEKLTKMIRSHNDER